jgi:dimeric dUTPase (all-alpha-NTP-PPase superfamily)
MSKINELYQKHVTYELQALKKEQHAVLNTDKIHQKVLAFLSELGKVSEESRCYSFWDTSALNTEDLLEYYTDGLQLLLSIGFDLKIDSLKQYPELQQKTAIIDQFLKVYNDILQLQQSYQFEEYQSAIDDYFTLGFLLGFDIDTITESYKEHI